MIRIILSFIVVLTIAGDSQTGAAPTANSVSAPDTILDTNTKQGVDAFETDIVLTDEQKNILLTPAAAQKNGNSIKDEAATGFDTDIWPNNVVPLVIDSDVDKDAIWNGAKYWEDKTCVSFVTRTDQVDYVHVKKSNGCSSYVGRIFGKQTLWISADCGLGGIIHELGHVLGFWHEQSRPDRDTYVTILWENIVTGKEDQFQKYSHMLVDSREVDYDYDSIMHYSAYAYSSNGKPTIEAVKEGAEIGQRNEPSDLDIEQVIIMYSCPTESTSALDSSVKITQTKTALENTEEVVVPSESFLLQHATSGRCLTAKEIIHGYTLIDPYNTEYEATFSHCQSYSWANQWIWNAEGHIVHAATNLCLSSRENAAELVLRSCKAKMWRMTWSCDSYLIMQPQSGYCLSNNEGEVSSNNKVTVPHSLEKELSNMLKSSKDTMTPTATLGQCDSTNHQQYFVVYNTSNPICSSFPLHETPSCYAENTTNKEGWMRCSKHGHYVSGFTFNSDYSPFIAGLVCCMSPLHVNNRKDVMGTYPLAGATNCYQRNWWASHAASKFQCHHGEYLNGVRFIGFSAQRGECCHLEGKEIQNGYNECKKKSTSNHYLGCGEEEEGSKGLHVTWYHYSSIMRTSTGQCVKEIECCK